MLSTLLLTLSVGVAPEQPKEPPAKMELFAREGWYKEQKGDEKDFVGTLERVKGPEIGFGRFNPYRLKMNRDTREVYVGGKPDVLAPYVGKTVKLTGKAVDMEVEGRMHREIWPARLEVVADEKKPDEKKELEGRAVILGDHKLYKMEPGQEKEFVGTLRKGEKGGYYLELTAGKAVGREDLVLYGDAGDPLAPYVGKRVKIVGKQVAGAVGMRTFQHTLPGRLEVLPPEEKKEPRFEEIKPDQVDREVREALRRVEELKFRLAQQDDRSRQEDDLPRLEAELRRRQEARQREDETRRQEELRREEERRQQELQRRLEEEAQQRRLLELRLREEAKKADGKELKVIARGAWRARVGAQAQQDVIRSPEELAKVTGQPADAAEKALTQALKVDKIDWQTQMVVVVTGGTKNTGGYSVEITGVTLKGDALTVSWKLNTPKPGQPVTQAITHPAQAVLVEKADFKSVTFDPAK
jgi:hypothetical protein